MRLNDIEYEIFADEGVVIADLDELSLTLTAEEARRLARLLVSAADLAVGYARYSSDDEEDESLGWFDDRDDSLLEEEELEDEFFGEDDLDE